MEVGAYYSEVFVVAALKPLILEMGGNLREGRPFDAW